MTFTLTANFDELDGGADTETTEVTIDSNVQVISSGGAIFSRLTATVTNGILSVTLPDNTSTPGTFGFVVRRAYGYTKKWQVPVQAPGATVDLSDFTDTTPLPIPASLESRVEALEQGGGGGGGATDLDDLTDVVITAAASGDILRHNGTNWVDTPGTTHFDAAGSAAAAQAAAIAAAATDATTKANAAQAAAIAASQPVDSDLTAIAALTTTAYGRAFLGLANQAALLGLLPAASETVASILEIATQAETTTGIDDARAVTPLKLQTRLAAYAQPLDADLTSIAALSTTTFGRALLTMADAAATRTALALGTAATVNTGTSSGDVPLLSTGGVLPIARLATGTPDGTKFVRDDGTLVTPSGGGGGDVAIQPLGSGFYVTPLSGANPTASAPGNGVMCLMPIVVDRSLTLDRIGLEVTTLAASSAVRLGIYNDTNGLPSTLVLDAGTIDSTTTGYKELTISQALTPGRYYLAAVPQGGSPTVRCSSRTGLLGHTTGSTLSGFTISEYRISGISGALPSPAGTAASGSESSPRVVIRTV